MTMHDCKCLCILCVTDMLIDTVDINRKMDYLCGNVARMFKKRTGCVCVRVFFFLCVCLHVQACIKERKSVSSISQITVRSF